MLRVQGEDHVRLQFDLPHTPTVPIVGSQARYPVRRIFCVGRNYAAHALELGNAIDQEAPIWFTKAPAALSLSDTTIPYPPGTSNCHYEMELVVAIGAPAFRISAEQAMSTVFGYACGLDMTRRDLQNAAKAKGYPWDTGKDYENGAIIAPITPMGQFEDISDQCISLLQNTVIKQNGTLSDMIWSIPELISDLSRLYHLTPGDLIYTGTPAGVGPIAVGDVIEGCVEGLTPVRVIITPAE